MQFNELEFEDKKKLSGYIGGLVSGFIREKHQSFIISFVKSIESDHAELNITSSFADKLINRLTGKRSISNSALQQNFSKPDSINKNKNIDTFVENLIESYGDTFEKSFDSYKISVKKNAKEEKKRIMRAIENGEIDPPCLPIGLRVTFNDIS